MLVAGPRITRDRRVEPPEWSVPVGFLVADAALSLAVDSSAMLSDTIYSYSVPAGGFDHVGNVLGYSDFVMGTWSQQYDHLNRLMSTSQSSGAPGAYPEPYAGQNLCFDDDSFGNRTQSDLLHSFRTQFSPMPPCALLDCIVYRRR